jgi:hypothetical protein
MPSPHPPVHPQVVFAVIELPSMRGELKEL